MHRNLSEFFWVLFYPLAALWAVVAYFRRHFLKPGYQSTLPTICFGNLHSGGSGKTPLVIEAVRHFSFLKPVVLSRGYKRNPNSSESVNRMGDEPWMIQQETQRPILVGKNRAALAKQVEKEKLGELLILDDGFQNFSLKKTVNIVCIHSEKKITESNCLPLGELRESFSALKGASAVVLVGNEPLGVSLWRSFLEDWDHLKIFEAPTSFEISEPLKKGTYIAFSGIAAPDRFKRTLEGFSCPYEFTSFPDHHVYSEKDVQSLIAQASKHEAVGFITTQKDYYKVVELFKKYKKNLQFVKMSAHLKDDFWSFLRGELKIK